MFGHFSFGVNASSFGVTTASATGCDLLVADIATCFAFDQPAAAIAFGALAQRCPVLGAVAPAGLALRRVLSMDGFAAAAQDPLQRNIQDDTQITAFARAGAAAAEQTIEETAAAEAGRETGEQVFEVDAAE